MLSGILKRALYLFIAVVMLTGLSMAQDKNDSQGSKNMNRMKMDHSHMKQAVDSTSVEGSMHDGTMDNCSDKPGECSKKGMKSSEVSVKDSDGNSEDSSIVREGVVDLNEIDANKDGLVYQDMMDYNVISDAPGTCPLCGMTLKEVSLEKAKMYLEKTGHKVSNN